MKNIVYFAVLSVLLGQMYDCEAMRIHPKKISVKKHKKKEAVRPQSTTVTGATVAQTALQAMDDQQHQNFQASLAGKVRLIRSDIPRNITAVIIPATVETLEDGLFEGCQFLTNVSFERDSSLKAISKRAFAGTPIMQLDIPASVETIGEEACTWCQKLAVLNFSPSSKLTTIGKNAFSHTYIQSLTIPASVQTIEDYGFYSIIRLRTLTFELNNANLESIGLSAFGDCLKLEGEIIIPASVKKIGELAFSSCGVNSKDGFIFEFERGSKFEEFDWRTFVDSGITELTIPNSLKKLGGWIFGGYTRIFGGPNDYCHRLRRVKTEGTPPALTDIRALEDYIKHSGAIAELNDDYQRLHQICEQNKAKQNTN